MAKKQNSYNLVNQFKAFYLGLESEEEEDNEAIRVDGNVNINDKEENSDSDFEGGKDGIEINEALKELVDDKVRIIDIFTFILDGLRFKTEMAIQSC